VSRRETDLISMCRPFIREPRLNARWKSGDRNPSKCISCSRYHRIILDSGPRDVWKNQYCTGKGFL